VTKEQIEALKHYRQSDAFDAKEKATIRFADFVTRGATAIDEEILTDLRQ
jgi:alkylhydroperoxidase family enzyme